MKRSAAATRRRAAVAAPAAPVGGAGVYKPFKAYRLPMALAQLFRELAAEEVGTDETEHVRAAARAYLIAKGKLKAPTPPAEAITRA